MHGLTDSQLCLAMEDKYPAAEGIPERLRFLIRYAILAPSIRRSQPWRFEAAGDRVDLYLDRTRNRRSSDPELRELVVSCGAALRHLQVAMRHFGLVPKVTPFPTRSADLLARVEVQGEQPATDDETVLFYAIHKWLDVPKPYRTRKKVPSEVVRELVEMANTEKTWMHCYEEMETRRMIAELIARSDLAQQRRVASHDRKARKKGQDGHLRMGDGLRNQVGHIRKYMHSFLLRPWRHGRVLDEYREEIAETSTVVAILGTRDNEPADWLAAGEVVAAVLLRGLSVGLHASFLNQPVEVPEFRRKLVERLGLPEFPQLMFRFGFQDISLRDRHEAHPSVHEDML